MSTSFRLVWFIQFVSLLVCVPLFCWLGSLVPSLLLLLFCVLFFGDIGIMLYREKMPEEKIRYRKSCAMGIVDMLCTLVFGGMAAWIVFDVVFMLPGFTTADWQFWAFQGLLVYIFFRKIYIYKNFTYL